MGDRGVKTLIEKFYFPAMDNVDFSVSENQIEQITATVHLWVAGSIRESSPDAFEIE